MQNHSNVGDSVLFFIGELAVNIDELLEANLSGLVTSGEIHEQTMRYESYRMICFNKTMLTVVFQGGVFPTRKNSLRT